MKGSRGTDSARVISIIETKALRGTGTEGKSVSNS